MQVAEQKHCLKAPAWLKIKKFDKKKYSAFLSNLKKSNLNTVCIEGNCPNRYECFSNNTATFMVLGNTCTRNCHYCNVKTGKPEKPDSKEPEKIAAAIKKAGIKHAVITCVTRDDLSDGGAAHLAKTVTETRKKNPGCRIELLISDLNESKEALKKIIESKPDILGHNIETVKRVFSQVKPKGNYCASLELLKKTKEISPNTKTKSSLILGLGETKKEILQTMDDLREAECDFLAIGQYLQPTPMHAEIKKFYSPKEFSELKEKALKKGFSFVESGPLVRSSYHAERCIV